MWWGAKLRNANPRRISKNYRHFFTIGPIVTKISVNIATLIWSLSMTSDMYCCKHLRWRSPPSWISKNCCHVFTFWPIIAKVSRNIATLELINSRRSQESAGLHSQHTVTEVHITWLTWLTPVCSFRDIYISIVCTVLFCLIAAYSLHLLLHFYYFK